MPVKKKNRAANITRDAAAECSAEKKEVEKKEEKVRLECTTSTRELQEQREAADARAAASAAQVFFKKK